MRAGSVTRLAVAAAATTLFLAPAEAQADSTSVFVGADLSLRSARDDLIVPRASTGPGIGLSAGVRAIAGDGLIQAGLRARLAALFDQDGYPAAGLAHGLSAAYLFFVETSEDSWSIAIGPLFAWETDLLWLAQWDDAHLYWLGRTFLGLAARSWKSLSSSWSVAFSAEINALGSEARPPAYRLNNQDALRSADLYFVSVHRKPKLGSVFDWQTVRLQFDLIPRGTHGPVSTGHSVGLEARFLHTTQPKMAFVFELGFRYAYAWGL